MLVNLFEWTRMLLTLKLDRRGWNDFYIYKKTETPHVGPRNLICWEAGMNSGPGFQHMISFFVFRRTVVMTSQRRLRESQATNPVTWSCLERGGETVANKLGNRTVIKYALFIYHKILSLFLILMYALSVWTSRDTFFLWLRSKRWWEIVQHVHNCCVPETLPKSIFISMVIFVETADMFQGNRTLKTLTFTCSETCTFKCSKLWKPLLSSAWGFENQDSFAVSSAHLDFGVKPTKTLSIKCRSNVDMRFHF